MSHAAEVPVRTTRVWSRLGGVLFVAAAIRVYAWHQTAVLFNDGPVFLAIAEAVGQGRWEAVLSHPYHPLYPILIHLVSLLGVGVEHAAVSVSILGGLLGIAALHGLLWHALGLPVAWLGAWLLTLHPWAVDYSSDVMSEGLYLGLFLTSLAALLRLLDRPRMPAAILAGSCIVLAYLTRPEALGLLAVAGLAIGGRLLRDPEYRRQAIRPSAALLVVVILGLTPYVGLLSIEAGEWTLTQKKSVRALARGRALPTRTAAMRPGVASEVAPIWLPQTAARAGAGRPARDLAGAGEAAMRVVRTGAAALRYEVLPFVLLGAWGLWRRRDANGFAITVGLLAVLYSGLLVLLVWGAGYVSRRHALPFTAPLLGVAALGWVDAGTWLLERHAKPGSARVRRGPVYRGLMTAGLVGLLIVGWGPRDLRPRRDERSALRAAAIWLAENPGANRPVAAEKLRIAYYADTPFVPLAAAPGEDFESALRRGGAGWVVVDADRLDRYPGLAEGVGVWIEPVHRVERGGRRAVVFEILAPPAR